MKKLTFVALALLVFGLFVRLQDGKIASSTSLVSCENPFSHNHDEKPNGTHFCGVSPSPDPITFVQPDGTSFEAFLLVDGPAAYLETADGFTILQDPIDQFYRYATRGLKGDLFLTGVPVHARPERTAEKNVILQALTPHLRYAGEKLSEITEEQTAKNLTTTGPQAVFPATGVRRSLLLLIDFPDQLHDHSTAEMDNLANQEGYSVNGATGSFRDYYQEVSYGLLTVNTDVEGWYTATNNRAYYGVQDIGNRQYLPATELVREAVDAAEAAGVDFSQYDGDGDGRVDIVEIFHSGRGAEESGNAADIWSHRWALSGNSLSVNYDGVLVNDYIMQGEKYGGNITNIGVFVHEFGHALGLPDLYDTDGSSAGIGRWCCMAGGTWNNAGRTPAHMSAWCKERLGWVTPTVLSGDGSVNNMENIDEDDQVYRFDTDNNGEYFLLENRHRTGWDAHIPGNGLAIWHVDNSRNNNRDENHRLVDLEQADGNGQLYGGNSGDGGDVFPGSSGNNRFDCGSNPNSDQYDGNPSNINVYNINRSSNRISFEYDFCNTDCNISNIQQDGGFLNFDGITYDQQLIINYAFAPSGSVLRVTAAGQTQDFSVTGSPQTVTLTGLPGDGNTVSVNASFSTDASCSYNVNNLYTAPRSCRNDDICDALDITSNIGNQALVSCSNEGATTQNNEPRPQGGSCNAQNAWCENAISNTVWFKFTAPNSGSIDIDFTTRIDLQMAVWEAESCEQLQEANTRYLVAANDDNGSAGGYSPRIQNLTCLIPGKTYFVQVDGWNGTTGDFAFRISDPGINCGIAPSNSQGCGNNFATTSVGRGEWLHIRDNNNQVIASVNDGFVELGQIDASFTLFEGEGPRMDENNFPLLKRDWLLVPFNNQAATVRLYLTDQEFQDFQEGGGPASLAEMTLLKSSDGNCGDPSSGNTTVLEVQDYKENFRPGRHMLEYRIDGFSGFFPRASTALLPIDLLHFSGEATDKTNQLWWASSLEQNTHHHEIQRLPAYGTTWETIGQLPAAGWSETEIHYEWEDHTPLPLAYYRLKTVDIDGTFSLSPLVEIKRSANGLTIGRVFPNPVQEKLQVELYVEDESALEWKLLAPNGQQIQTGRQILERGLTNLPLDLVNLSSGLYFLQLHVGQQTITKKILKE